jgi:hypothetical protein
MRSAFAIPQNQRDAAVRRAKKRTVEIIRWIRFND